jgi:Tfp pilus assembly protein PilF
MKLVDVGSGAALWANTYDNRDNPADLFAFEDEIANQVAAVLADKYGIIPRILARQALEKRAKRLETYDAMLRYYHYVTVFSEEPRQSAKEALEQAVQLDPNNPLTLAMLADVYKLKYEQLGGDETVLAQVETLLQRAVTLDPCCQHARFVGAFLHYYRGERNLFISEVEAAIALNPNNASVVAGCGFFLALVGEWERGMGLVEKAMHLNPHHPPLYHFPFFLNYYRQGLYPEALREAMRINTPGLMWDPLSRAAALGQLGLKKEAEVAVRELLALQPNLSTQGYELMHRVLFSDENVDILVEGLRTAGLELKAG